MDPGRGINPSSYVRFRTKNRLLFGWIDETKPIIVRFRTMFSDPSRDRPVVLLVEDEPLLRFFASDVLEEAGFDVIETGNADEALIWLDVRNDVRVIVTDIQMPGRMNGLDLAALVHHRWPGILILIVSGEVRPTTAELPEGGRFVAKPYEGSAVVHHLREMLASMA
jgi:DNA-binding response OmpR family regulator